MLVKQLSAYNLSLDYTFSHFYKIINLLGWLQSYNYGDNKVNNICVKQLNLTKVICLFESQTSTYKKSKLALLIRIFLALVSFCNFQCCSNFSTFVEYKTTHYFYLKIAYEIKSKNNL